MNIQVLCIILYYFIIALCVFKKLLIKKRAMPGGENVSVWQRDSVLCHCEMAPDCFLKTVNLCGWFRWGDTGDATALNPETVTCFHSSLPLQHF